MGDLEANTVSDMRLGNHGVVSLQPLIPLMSHEAQ